MKFISFVRLGKCGFGILAEDGIVDLTERLAPGLASLKALIAADMLQAAASFARGRPADFALSDVTLLPVVGRRRVVNSLVSPLS